MQAFGEVPACGFAITYTTTYVNSPTLPYFLTYDPNLMAYTVNSTTALDINQYLIQFTGTLIQSNGATFTQTQIWILDIIGSFIVPTNSGPPTFNSAL
jgi:hypothetical protein